MKIPLEIQRTKDPDGSINFKAVISFQDAIADSSQSQKLIQIQNEFAKSVRKWQSLLKERHSSRELMSNSRLMWRLADEIYLFIMTIENKGYAFVNASDALAKELGMSQRQLERLVQFRRYYSTVDQIAENINWSKYIELLSIPSSETRKICQKRILEGKIKTIKQLRAFKTSQRHR
jgi:hypothetical protein